MTAGSRLQGTFASDNRVGVVVITRNRVSELTTTLSKLADLPERPHVVVVDNGSSDDTVAMVERDHPGITLVRLADNRGGAARNVGAARLTTPYLAFCDDDSWWDPGALAGGADLLERDPRIAAVCGRVLVGPQQRLDPTSAVMARSPLEPRPGQPGPRLIGFVAAATIIRRQLFLAKGGFPEPYGVGGEEEPLVLDLLADGWDVCYAPELVVHHHPSIQRDVPGRRAGELRNRLWTAWSRYPASAALRATLQLGAPSLGDRDRRHGLAQALRGLPWCLRRRQPLAPAEMALLETVRRTG
jgi:GT2 family glycosyltransferase